MSVLSVLDSGWVISHENYLESVYENTFDNVTNTNLNLRLCGDLFKIITPFKGSNHVSTQLPVSEEVGHKKGRKRKNADNDCTLAEKKEADRIEAMCLELLQQASDNELFEPEKGSLENGNESALAISRKIYSDFVKRPIEQFQGANNLKHPLMRKYMNETYLFPAQSKFYNKDVRDLGNTSDLTCSTLMTESFDLVVVDPPWWNKYIRQKRRMAPDEGYKMMSKTELIAVPVARLLAPGALVAVWCTNSSSNIEGLEKEVFPAWGAKYVATWYWLKTTRSGAPVCPFAPPRGKQPYERLLLARAAGSEGAGAEPLTDRVFVSVPSSLHSHKPPLDQLLSEFVRAAPRKLELFARYLLPGWSSYGNQVLLLQHASLYAPAETNEMPDDAAGRDTEGSEAKSGDANGGEGKSNEAKSVEAQSGDAKSGEANGGEAKGGEESASLKGGD